MGQKQEMVSLSTSFIGDTLYARFSLIDDRHKAIAIDVILYHHRISQLKKTRYGLICGVKIIDGELSPNIHIVFPLRQRQQDRGAVDAIHPAVLLKYSVNVRSLYAGVAGCIALTVTVAVSRSPRRFDTIRPRRVRSPDSRKYAAAWHCPLPLHHHQNSTAHR